MLCITVNTVDACEHLVTTADILASAQKGEVVSDLEAEGEEVMQVTAKA